MVSEHMLTVGRDPRKMESHRINYFWYLDEKNNLVPLIFYNNMFLVSYLFKMSSWSTPSPTRKPHKFLFSRLPIFGKIEYFKYSHSLLLIHFFSRPIWIFKTILNLLSIKNSLTQEEQESTHAIVISKRQEIQHTSLKLLGWRLRRLERPWRLEVSSWPIRNQNMLRLA